MPAVRRAALPQDLAGVKRPLVVGRAVEVVGVAAAVIEGD